MKAILAAAAALTLWGCNAGGHADADARPGDTLAMDYAEMITISEHPGYVRADITNPWDTTRRLHTYLLVADTAAVPDDLPAGTVVRTPLRRALIFSSVHNSLVCEMGAADAIRGVCDAAFIYEPELAARIASGDVADCGPAFTPDIERIISVQPDAIVLSPYESSGSYGRLGQLGVPIVECADYMETSPLGRAEWMKFYGLLFGRGEEASRMFGRTRDEYESLVVADSVTSRPKVLVDALYGQTWHVPGAVSTMGRFISDAGGTNPFAATVERGSGAMSAEQVLYTAADADIWLLRYNQATDKTLAELAKDNPVYSRFEAFGRGDVWGCNTARKLYYEEVAFHPQWLLRDLVALFHPELATDPGEHRYFTRLK